MAEQRSSIGRRSSSTEGLGGPSSPGSQRQVLSVQAERLSEAHSRSIEANEPAVVKHRVGQDSSPAARRDASRQDLVAQPGSDDGEVDFGSLFTLAGETPGRTGSVEAEKDQCRPLYGFQGVVPFLPQDPASFLFAVRRLLSLPGPGAGTDAEEPYTLVHYDVASETVVEIEDDLWLGADAAGVEYVARDLDGFDQRSAIFVRLRDEQTPPQWAPHNSQLRADVARIVADAPEGLASSYAYLSFPKTCGGTDGEPAASWDVTESTAAVRTAIDVLVGPGRHDVFRFLTGAGPGTSISHGLAPLRSSDLDALHSFTRLSVEAPPPPWPPLDIRLLRRDLEEDQIALFLPGYYPHAAAGIDVITLADLGNEPIISSGLALPGAVASVAAARIRAVVARFLDASDDAGERRDDVAAELRHVRLIIGSPGDCPKPRQQQQLLLPLRDKPGSVLDPEVAAALSSVAAAPPRSIHIFPEYRRRDTRMVPGWESFAQPSALDDEDAASVALPPLGSSITEFRQHVAELSRLFPCRAIQGVTYDARVHHVGIRSLLPVADEADARRSPLESLTFFLDPDATDDDWFRVRSQISTRKAIICIFPAAEARSWCASVARSNVWGPRYGRVAASQPRHRSSAVRPQVPIQRDVSARELDPARNLQSSGCDLNREHPEDQARSQPGLDTQTLPGHAVRQCLWCHELLGHRGSTGERDQHLLQNHRHELLELLGIQRASQHHHYGPSGAVPRMPAVGSQSSATATPVRTPLAELIPADEDEDTDKETDKENDPRPMPVHGGIDGRGGLECSHMPPLTDAEGPAGLAVSSMPPLADVEGPAGLRASPMLPLTGTDAELWSIGARYLSRLLAIPPSVNPLAAPVGQHELQPEDDFCVYVDPAEAGAQSDTPAKRGWRAEHAPTVMPGPITGTTAEAAAHSGPRNEDVVEDQAQSKPQGPRQVADPSGPRGKKRQRPSDDKEDAEASAENLETDKTRKRAKTAASKAPKMPKAGNAAKTAQAARPKATKGSKPAAKDTKTAKKRNAPVASTAVSDEAPAPKRAKRQAVAPDPPPAEPARRSARLRAKDKK